MKMRYIVIALISVLLSSSISLAQKNNGLDFSKLIQETQKKGQTSQRDVLPNINNQAEKKWKTNKQIQGNLIDGKGVALKSFVPIKNDSVLYAKIVKRNGWWEGVGKPITKEHASHLSCYFKLKNSNPEGHYTQMEALNGYGNLTTSHNLRTYLIDPSNEEDKGANEKWKERLQTVCKWEFISDNYGKEVIQERGKDADDNVVYIYHPIKVGKHEYTGSYTDSWGMPVLMRTDSVGNDAGYANCVHITRDERGYDVLVMYTDRQGYNQKNYDGAYGTRRDWDNSGNITITASVNMVGGLMIDDAGNCGFRYEHDPKTNLCIRANSIDDYNQPIAMPYKTSGYRWGTYGFEYYYDQWGRDTMEMFLDKDGKPGVNQFGCQKIKKKYNNHGQQIEYAFYDPSGNLIEGSLSGVAIYRYAYNEKGLLTKLEAKNSKGHYVNVNNWDTICCRETTFYPDGKTVKNQTEYIANKKGEKLPRFLYTADEKGNTQRIWPNKYLIRIDSVDSKGRKILYKYSYTYMDGSSLYRFVTKYDDEHSKYTNLEYDDKGRLSSKEQVITDSINHTVVRIKESHNQINSSSCQQFSPDWSTILREWEMTPYGEHARVGWNNELYYKRDINHTMYDDVSTIIIKNEFGEPAYSTSISDNNKVAYHFQSKNAQDIIMKSAYEGEYGVDMRYFDENGKEITNMETFVDSLPKAYCIEVVDTTKAYPLGFRNGDIIIKYGDWTTTTDLLSNLDYFYLETILKATEPKEVLVLRHNPQQGSSEIKKIHINDSSISSLNDMGIYAHKICYTQREKQRLFNACAKEGIKLPITFDTTGFNNNIMLTFQSLVNLRSWGVEDISIPDPAIVLFAKRNDQIYSDENTSVVWDALTNDWNYWNYWEENSYFYYPDIELYYSLGDSSTYENNPQGLMFVPLAVSNEVFNKMRECYSKAPIPKNKMTVFTVEDNGMMYDKDFWGTYVLLQYNDWLYGQDYSSLSEKLPKWRHTDKKLSFMRLKNYGESLAEAEETKPADFYNLTFPDGMLGIRFSYTYLPDTVRNEAIRRTKELKPFEPHEAKLKEISEKNILGLWGAANIYDYYDANVDFTFENNGRLKPYYDVEIKNNARLNIRFGDVAWSLQGNTIILDLSNLEIKDCNLITNNEELIRDFNNAYENKKEVLKEDLQERFGGIKRWEVKSISKNLIICKGENGKEIFLTRKNDETK